MKYLYLIIRHIFPRRRWKIIHTAKLWDEGGTMPCGTVITLQDQFGNIKIKKQIN